jgi:predicted nuclease of predicted toxin-antitoxin system
LRRPDLKFLADENIRSKSVYRLQKEGIDTLHVNNIKYGLADNDVLKVAYKEKRILQVLHL